MNMREYLAVKDYTYLEYCDYLQQKYGIGLDDYMTKSFNPKAKCKRTKEGLLAHHKKEDTMILLSTKEVAAKCPFEWQTRENIVYCDYLEHLLLHILICKYPSNEKADDIEVGIGGVVCFIVPELNDLYSGWQTKQAWRKICHDKVKNDKDVYLALLKQFIAFEEDNEFFNVSMLCKSFNEKYGGWSDKQNRKLYAEIRALNADKSGAIRYTLLNAIDVVMDAKKASTTLLQNKLNLDYAEAAKTMDELEAMGIIGPFEGSKPRRVLISKQDADKFKQIYASQSNHIEDARSPKIIKRFWNNKSNRWALFAFFVVVVVTIVQIVLFFYK